MKKDLLSIAMGLSDKEIMQLSRLKKDGGKKLTALRAERKKLSAALAKIDEQITALGGSSSSADAAPRRKKRAKKEVGAKKSVAKKPAAEKLSGKKPAKAAPRRAKKGKIGLTEGVRQALAQSGSPLRASEIVDALPSLGYKVKNVAAIRKRVSIVLATQKKNFAQAARGLYQLAE